MKTINTPHKNENGLASIIIVTIIIALLALVTIGFAKIMDRNYRQATDRQLASEANYAAESGMNDARSYVIKNGDVADTGGKCMNLANTPPAPFAKDGNISNYYTNLNSNTPVTDTTIKYTCVIIDTRPSEITKQVLKKNQSVVYKIVPNGGDLSNLYLSWQNANDSNLNTLGAYSLPKETTAKSNDDTGILRTTLYPAVNDPSGGDENTYAANASRTYFMFPDSGAAGTAGTKDYTQNAKFVDGKCNIGSSSPSNTPLPDKQGNLHYCNSIITGLAPAPPAPPPPTPKTYTVTVGTDNVVDSFYINGQLVGLSYPVNGWGNNTGTVSLTSPPQEYSIKAENTLNGFPWAANPAMVIFTVKDNSTGAIVARSGGGLGFQGLAQSSSSDPAGWPRPNTTGWGSTSYQNFGGPVTWGFSWQSLMPGWPDPSAQFMWPTNGIGDANISKNIDYLYAGSAPAPPPPPPPPQPVAPFYYLRLTALYSDLDVTIQGSDSSGAAIKFIGAQATIDVTGEGNDTLKRLHGTMPLNTNLPLPNFAIQSMDTLCKRFRLPKSSPNGYDPATLDDLTTAGTNPDSACHGGP